ncbi:MAG TPA: hypothetical protein PLX08_01975 [Bacteroidales bacterium]|jgi:hypothetical protein|nr:hypothetical protein [Bacteroidales bacterium]
MKKLFLILFCLLSISSVSQTKRVLFIGNSYTLNNNLPDITADVAASAGDELIYGTAAFASYTLQLHTQNPTTLSMIRQGGWDYVVLQEFSQNPSEPIEWVQTNVFPYAQYLDNEINTYNPGAETIFYMTWGRRDGDADRCSRLPEVCTYEGMDDLTRERYMMMARNYHGVVSPVGAVWRYLRQNYPAIELYDADGSHPSQAGSYAGACCFYTAVFRKDPSLITYNYTLSSSTAAIIRNAVREVVYNHLPTWYLEQTSDFTIYATAGSGGTISPSGSQTVTPGSGITFSITPNSGYVINNVTVDNTSAGAVSSYTFSAVSANHTISATFRPSACTITSSAGTGGSISPSGSTTVSYGGSRTYTITPSTGYRISDVRVDNVSIGAVNTYTFSNVMANHSITASFAIITFSINTSSGSGGSISPGGTVTVNYGSDRTFSITPATGYYISDVEVDNESVGGVSSYTFEDVVSNHSISAKFSILRYTITASSGTGGSVTPAGTSAFNYGTNITYNITPATGYRITDVKIDDVSVGVISSYTFSNLSSNHTVSASFAILTFTLNSSAGNGGSVSPQGVTTVNYGTCQKYTVTPSTGYYISDVKVDDISVGPVNEYNFTNITGNHSISASFSIKTFVMTSSSNTGGVVSPAGNTTVNYGSDLTYDFTPDYGFRIKDVIVDNVSKGKITSFVFKAITDNHSISVVYEPIPVYRITATAGTGGSITPAGTTDIFEGSDLTFSIVPDPEYRILAVSVDNLSAGSDPEYTFSDITGNHVITARFTTDSEVKAYPNPFRDFFNIKIASPFGYTFDLEVIDNAGRLVYAQYGIPGNDITPVVMHKPDGIYMARILLNGRKIASFKLLKAQK